MKIIKFFYTLFFHRRIIAALEAELEKPFEVRLKEFRVNMGAINATMESPAISVFTEAMIGLYRSFDGANNYLSFSAFEPKTNELFELTIQRKEGKTPSEIVGELREKMDRFDQMVAIINEIVDNGGMANEETLKLFLERNNLLIK